VLGQASAGEGTYVAQIAPHLFHPCSSLLEDAFPQDIGGQVVGR
jgi:hypothetical protein